MTVRSLSSRLDDSTARLSAGVQSRVSAAIARAEEPADAGMSTAEYAIGTVAACGLAAALVGLLKSGAVVDVVKNVIIKAFKNFL